MFDLTDDLDENESFCIEMELPKSNKTVFIQLISIYNFEFEGSPNLVYSISDIRVRINRV